MIEDTSGVSVIEIVFIQKKKKKSSSKYKKIFKKKILFSLSTNRDKNSEHL